MGCKPSVTQRARLRDQLRLAAQRRRQCLGGGVECHGVVAATVGDHPLRGFEKLETLPQYTPQREQVPNQREKRRRILTLGLDVVLLWVDRREPGLAGREAAVR